MLQVTLFCPTLKKTFDKVEKVNLLTSQEWITILPNHIPIYDDLGIQRLKIYNNNKIHNILINGGFFILENNIIKIFVEKFKESYEK